MENATCVVPWALDEADYVEQTQVFPGARPQSDGLGGWLGGMGAEGLGPGEGGAPVWPSSFSSDVPIAAVK